MTRLRKTGDNPARAARYKKWTDWDKLMMQYALAHGLPEAHERHHEEELENLVERREEYAKADKQAEIDDAFLAKHGDGRREPPRDRDEVSYGVFFEVHDAWEEAHPDIIAKRNAKRDAKYEAWQAEAKAEAAKLAGCQSEDGRRDHQGRWHRKADKAE